MSTNVDGMGWRVRIVGRLHGQVTNNVLHFRSSVGVMTDQALIDFAIALGTAVLACVVDTLLPAVTSDWQVTHVEAQAVFPTLSDPQIVSPVGNQTGAQGATSVSFAAQLVNLRTGVGGRRGRGKWFLPPPGEAQVANSITDAPTMALYAAFLTCIFEKFVGGARTESAELGVYSRADDGAVVGDFMTATRPVISLQAKAELARCGSRKVGRGA